MARPALAAYVSGHGFGHFTRSEAVLSRLAGEVAIHLRTNDKALPLARRASWAASVAEVDVGPGVVQRGPLETDPAETERRLAAHVARFDEIADSEAAALRGLGVRGVYADVPPIAFEAAARAGAPSIGLANFSWSWIYEEVPGCSGFAKRLRRAEEKASSFLALPFAGGLSHFPGSVSIPLVSRAPTRSREEARRLLPVAAGEARPVVLLSFGGFGDALDLGEAARRNSGFFFVAFAPSSGVENLASLPHHHDLPHQDLVLAADALLGKPGYSTVAEAIVARRSFVMTPRGEFREFPVLVRGIEEHLPHARLSLEELLEGEWSGALRRALAAPVPPSRIALDGASVAARRIAELLGVRYS